MFFCQRVLFFFLRIGSQFFEGMFFFSNKFCFFFGAEDFFIVFLQKVFFSSFF